MNEDQKQKLALLMGREIKEAIDMSKLGNKSPDRKNKVTLNLPLPNSMKVHKVPEDVKNLLENIKP